MNNADTIFREISGDINTDAETFRIAAELINNGELVAFPTETVYGLGADAFNPDACKKIYLAKGRPSDNPLIVHVSELCELNKIVSGISETAVKLIKGFWPGPLTLIFLKSDSVPFETTGGLNTVAVRFPKHEAARMLIKASGCPIAAPSANVSGRPSPTTAEHVLRDLNGKIAMIIDGGAAEFGLESTIVDVSENVPVLLRPGSITLEMLQDICHDIVLDKHLLTMPEANFKPKAPGQFYKHYSPQAEMFLVKGSQKKVSNKINELINTNNKKTGVLTTAETVSDVYENAIVLTVGSRENPDSIASNIFGVLREFDRIGVDVIYSECFDESGVGFAIMNRLVKAAGYKIIVVE